MTEENSKMTEENKIVKINLNPMPYSSPHRPKVDIPDKVQYNYDPKYKNLFLSSFCLDFTYHFRYNVIETDENIIPEQTTPEQTTHEKTSNYNEILERIDWSLALARRPTSKTMRIFSTKAVGILKFFTKFEFKCILNSIDFTFDKKFVYNYDGLKERMEKSGLKQQIISIALHPWRITRMCHKFRLGFNCLREKLFYRMHRSGLKAELISVVFYHTLYEEIASTALHPDRLKWILKEYNIKFSTLIKLLFY